ncbi:MAG: DUF692 domain-containing protein [Rubripirellula sp.]|nr:DUF692 domain-containing protein [Rubripirellula sp.]
MVAVAEAVAEAVEVEVAAVVDAVVAGADKMVEEFDSDAFVEVPLVGLGFRAPFADWILDKPDAIECVELTAEHFFDGGEPQLEALRELYPLSVHGLGLSLGTPGKLDTNTLDHFKRVANLANAKWISEHIAFTKTDDVDLGHLNPVPLTKNSLQTLIDHSREVLDACQRPLLLENITSYLRVPEEIPETDFINQLCQEAGVGLLLDVTNLFINSRNHQFDPVEWLHRVEPSIIRQLHIVGYSFQAGVWHDRHSEPIQEELFELAADVVSYAPVESIIIERDGAFPSCDQLEIELKRLEDTCESARTH